MIRILSTYLPNIHPESATLFLHGSDCGVLDINHEYIFKFPRRKDVCAKLRKEASLLTVLSSNTSLRVPKVIATHISEECLEDSFIGLHKIHGVANDYCNSKGHAHALGIFLARLHSVPIEMLKDVGLPVLDHCHYAYMGFYKTSLPLSRLLRSLTGSEYSSGIFSMNYKPTCSVLIHGDLSASHVIYLADEPTINGVIDWADACLGDPAFEFARILNAYGVKMANNVLNAYGGADLNFRHRILDYATVILINRLAYSIKKADFKTATAVLMSLISQILKNETFISCQQ